jgi:hypothetical protein
MNPMRNEIWLGEIVDQDLLFLLPKEICIWFGKWEMLKVLYFTNGGRESFKICNVNG